MCYFSAIVVNVAHFILLSGLLLSSSYKSTADAVTIIIGDNRNQQIGWTEGVCYVPIQNVHVGDKIVFEYGGHNIYKMEFESSFLECDFKADGVALMAGSNESPFSYTITEDDRRAESIYFSCGVGSHCAIGQQKVRLNINEDDDYREEDPISRFAFGLNEKQCEIIQQRDEDENDDEFDDTNNDSSCSDPVSLEIDDKGHQWYSRSCLSPRMTMTPGGIINQAYNVQYPYPTDRRVVIGDRIWEFVEENSEDDGGLNIVHLNQLYVHHTLGGVIIGNGAESVRQKDEDAAFPLPYGKLSGTYDTFMTYHIIDLRQVSDENILGCVECRCKEGTYTADPYGAGYVQGGIGCCTNCTALTSPMIDYRLRYNVTYMDIPKGEYIEPVHYITADIAWAVGNSIEFDVPYFTKLPLDQQHPDNPKIQVIKHEGSLRDLFQEGLFDGSEPRAYSRSDTMKIHRITGHMHIGGMEMYIEDLESGKIIHSSEATYGTDPDIDEGFITKMGVTNFDPPLILSADQELRLVTHYDASDTSHLGVMGLFTLWFSEGGDGVVQVGPSEASMTMDYCLPDVCDASHFPDIDSLSYCVDAIEDTIVCTEYEICSCKTFLEYPNIECGGNIENQPVNSFCAKSCDSCEVINKENIDESRKVAIMKEITTSLDSMCDEYPTSNCTKYIANMDACIEKNPGFESLHDALKNVLATEGRFTIDEYSRFGHPSLHRGNTNSKEEEKDGCTTTPSSAPTTPSSAPTLANGAWTMNIEMFYLFHIIVYFVS